MSKTPHRPAQQADLVRMLATYKSLKRSLNISEPIDRAKLEIILLKAKERESELISERDYSTARVFGFLVSYLEVKIRDMLA